METTICVIYFKNSEHPFKHIISIIGKLGMLERQKTTCYTPAGEIG